jgi:hypothetical protein
VDASAFLVFSWPELELELEHVRTSGGNVKDGGGEGVVGDTGNDFEGRMALVNLLHYY